MGGWHNLRLETFDGWSDAWTIIMQFKSSHPTVIRKY
jgi:hypothetical protein